MPLLLYLKVMINKEDVLAATDGGKNVILEYYPQASVGFSGRRNFKIRSDDRNASAVVFNEDGIWFVQDKGGSDTKAYTAITLVMEKERLTFPQALKHIAHKYAPHLVNAGTGYKVEPKPKMEEVPGVDEIQIKYREGGQFWDYELAYLGWKIQQCHCDALQLKPVEYYITRKNEKGKSYKISPNQTYPIFAYDYGNWGKIYQPLGKLRFMSYGKKPDDFIFGDSKFLQMFQDAKTKSKFPETGDGEDERMAEVILCSGGSDALNVRAAGYHVCWLNSETAELKGSDLYIIKRLAKEVYVCYDMDETGLRNTYKLCMKDLDLKILLLPDDLTKIPTGKPGKYCKDVKDMMMKYRTSEEDNPHKIFAGLVKTAHSMKFWSIGQDKKGNPQYKINSVVIKIFLSACGIYRIGSTAHKCGYTFAFIKNNIVELIDESAITGRCKDILIEYLRRNHQYYSMPLHVAINDTKSIIPSNLDNMEIVKPNFKAWGKGYDHVFFRNCAAKVTADGISIKKHSDLDCYIYSKKILDFDFVPEKPFFEIRESREYKKLKNQLATCRPPAPEYYNIKKEIDALRDIDKYEVSFTNWDCTFMRYLYNTGRQYWRKEELGIALTEDERKEVDLHFINKVTALGYMMYKYKEKGTAYGVYAMEIEQSDEGEHKGGTGKSMYMDAVRWVRKSQYIEGQRLKPDSDDFMFEGVQQGITDFVNFDDLRDTVDLHRFLNIITGEMKVNAKYVAALSLDYLESPKVGFSSNHAIKKFDASLRRRTWFTAFSDYYHPESQDGSMRRRSPYDEFGKNIPDDYSTQEMNMFYNFLLQCLSTYIRLNEKIQPPMQQLERRMLQRSLTDEFIYWADNYFSEERLNTEIDREVAFEDYKHSLSKRIADTVKASTFRKKVIDYCRYKGYTFNPPQMLRTATEKERNEIRRKINGKDCYFFYIATEKLQEDDANILPVEDDKPPFPC